MQPNPNFTDRLLLSPKSAKFRSKRLSTFFLFRDRLLSSLRNVHYQSFGLSSFSFLGRILSYSSNVQSRPFLPSMSLSFGSSNFILTVHIFNRSVRPSWTVHLNGTKTVYFGSDLYDAQYSFCSNRIHLFHAKPILYDISYINLNFPTSIDLSNFNCSFPTSLILSKFNQNFPT